VKREINGLGSDIRDCIFLPRMLNRYWQTKRAALKRVDRKIIARKTLKKKFINLQTTLPRWNKRRMDWNQLMICEANYQVIAKLRMLKERIPMQRLHLRKYLLVHLKCIDQEGEKKTTKLKYYK
jgi:hypothetical protein